MDVAHDDCLNFEEIISQQNHNELVSSNDEENYRNHYEPMPGCSHWSDDDPDHNHKKKKKYIAPKPKIQSLPSVSI